MKRGASLAVALFFCWATSPGAGAQEDDVGELVDQVADTVGTTPITRSRIVREQEIRAQLQIALKGRDRYFFGRLLLSNVAVRWELIFREVLRQASLSHGVPAPDDTDVRERVEAFESSFRTGADFARWLRRWRWSYDELSEFFREALRLDRAADQAVEGLVIIDDGAARRYYEEYSELKYGGRPYDEVSADVARRVYERKFDRTFQSWKERLLSGAKVRHVQPLERQ